MHSFRWLSQQRKLWRGDVCKICISIIPLFSLRTQLPLCAFHLWEGFWRGSWKALMLDELELINGVIVFVCITFYWWFFLPILDTRVFECLCEWLQLVKYTSFENFKIGQNLWKNCIGCMVNFIWLVLSIDFELIFIIPQILFFSCLCSLKWLNYIKCFEQLRIVGVTEYEVIYLVVISSYWPLYEFWE
jgi:hypothetical protein